jgi:hypothetical protein
MPSANKSKKNRKFESSGKLRRKPSSVMRYNKSIRVTSAPSYSSSASSSRSSRRYDNSNKHKYSTEYIVRVLLQLLNNIKLYHWNTFSYPQHKATDELYSSLGDNIDKFVEILLGKEHSRINTKYIQEIKIHNLKDEKALIESINRYKVYLEHMPESFGTDLLNIRDEILGDLNKFLYLLTLE